MSSDPDLYQGSRLSSLGAFASFALTVGAVILLVTGRWREAIMAFLASLVATYVSYRMSGGRKNPALLREHLKAVLEKKGVINPLADLWHPWSAAVQNLFSTLEEHTGGDYAAALDLLRVRSSSTKLMDACLTARGEPTRQNWINLRDEMIRDPPYRAGGYYGW